MHFHKYAFFNGVVLTVVWVYPVFISLFLFLKHIGPQAASHAGVSLESVATIPIVTYWKIVKANIK